MISGVNGMNIIALHDHGGQGRFETSLKNAAVESSKPDQHLRER